MSDYISREALIDKAVREKMEINQVEAREMKCKWYAAFEGVCTNGECPYRGDTCPTSEYPEVCKYAEKKPEIPQLSAEELVKSLRLCNIISCRSCAFCKSSNCRSILMSQVADMLEKLAAEGRKEAGVDQRQGQAAGEKT